MADTNEPTWAPHLRVATGIAGLLRGYADMGDPLAPETCRRLGERLLEACVELHRALQEREPRDFPP